ncbi:fibronectin type III domain-containing protein [uncultured Jatrophihabitans sp.]|uniref:fibronectin type III domain-containing protein n=1 Tax=uncultured Jatrophihabitans sp. TaxID=1610747 RepID=UPI0035CB533A
MTTVLATVLTGSAVVSRQVSASAAAPARQAAVPAGSPTGHVDVMNRTAGGLWVKGWTFDPSAPTTANAAYAWVDGRNVHSGGPAANNRPDVAAKYPAAGPLHGFSWRIPVPQGTHTVCVRAGNLGAGGPVTLKCRTTVFNYGPKGSFESLTTTPGSMRLRGWAIDGDAWTTPLTLQLTVDGRASTIVADKPRSDIAASYPNTGTLHGFDETYRVAQGTHRVCVTALNIGYGSNASFGCRTLVVDDRPVAALDTLGESGGKLQIRGWAFDRDQPTAPLTVSVAIDAAAPFTLKADLARSDVAMANRGVGSAHGFATARALAEGRHTVCVVVRNVGYGSDRSLGCRSITVDFTPKASLTAPKPTATGMTVGGWAYDPDTSRPVSTRILLDGRTVTTVLANRKGSTRSGHNFAATLVSRSGRHTVCVIADNLLWGTRNSKASCQSTSLALSPLGSFESLTRAPGTDDLLVKGWAGDPDSSAPTTVTVTVDGRAVPALRADAARTDIARTYPSLGTHRGLSAVLATDDGEHRVCLTAKNVGGGTDRSLGCRLIYAVHPVGPSAPRSVKAVPGFGGATVSWTPPSSDGGAPVTKYVVTSSPGSASVTVAAGATSAVLVGLKSNTTYRFSVRASNVAGSGVPAVSAAIRTAAGPPAQRTPAPVSTSRYIRNVRGSSAAELAMMRREGATDAKNNPSGHGYMVLLDIGGQDYYDNGVVLSATTRFVSNRDLVRDVQAYMDGYASAQRPSAPVVVAIGTNNDMDVSAASGRQWATNVVNPLVSYARRHLGMSVAGANDIEPGFRASYSATRSWLGGYLSATKAPFVFNGSADGCAWTTTNRRCNNGWTMAGLHYLAAAAAPTRMLNLPQIYNNTMADQWKYISLTGVVNHLPRINFAGVLTEYTACAQSGGCGSMGGRSAWSRMWNDLQSDSRLRVSSLPYATDLRVDR